MKQYRQLIDTAKIPLSDKEYFSKFIKDMFFFNQHQLWSILDSESHIIETTKSAANLYGFSKPTMAIGLNYHGLIGKIPDIDELKAGQLHQQVKSVIEKTEPFIALLHVNEYYAYSTSKICIRTPIINPTTSSTVGILSKAVSFKLNHTLKSLINMHGNRFSKHTTLSFSNTQKNRFGLSIMEKNVLFCVCLGINNRKDIADFLSKIYRKSINHETTIGDAIRRLYRKLNCNTHFQLIEFAVYNSMHLEIPQAFLPTGSYLI